MRKSNAIRCVIDFTFNAKTSIFKTNILKSEDESNERSSAVLYMLDTVTVIQCFVTVRCLVCHCTDCEVNCNRVTESASQNYISYRNFVL
jgi:hypothetical protein